MFNQYMSSNRGILISFQGVQQFCKRLWTNFRDKLQFVNSVKRLVFELTKIPFLRRLISICRLIVEVLNDQNLFTESNLAK